MDPELRICELFKSIQGEGPFVGCPSLFVRFQGCNLIQESCGPCPFCDTAFAIPLKINSSYSEEDFCRAIREGGVQLLVLTGGEPLWQQLRILEVLSRVSSWEVPLINVETNGTIPPALNWPQRTFFSVSPKYHARDFLHLRDFSFFNSILKVVYDDTIPEYELSRFIFDCASQMRLVSPNQIYVMPNSKDRESFIATGKKCFDFCMRYNFRFGVREHLVLFNGERGT